jgi:3-hydroxyisobutyrate dehydrogenase-like beta-hydroxyacid dehydrogenase
MVMMDAPRMGGEDDVDNGEDEMMVGSTMRTAMMVLAMMEA